jgi:hypothetical protein
VPERVPLQLLDERALDSLALLQIDDARATPNGRRKLDTRDRNGDGRLLVAVHDARNLARFAQSPSNVRAIFGALLGDENHRFGHG